MNKKSKILFYFLLFVILGTFCFTFYRYFVKLDYYLQIQTECNPAKEKCFVATCNPDQDSTCPSVEADRKNYYQIILKKAYLVPICDPNDENCPKVTCVNDKTCQEVFCDEKNVPDGEACNNPKDYQPSGS